MQKPPVICRELRFDLYRITSIALVKVTNNLQVEKSSGLVTSLIFTLWHIWYFPPSWKFYSLSFTGASFWALLSQWWLLYYIGMAYTRILYTGMAEVSIYILILKENFEILSEFKPGTLWKRFQPSHVLKPCICWQTSQYLWLFLNSSVPFNSLLGVPPGWFLPSYLLFPWFLFFNKW